MPALDGPPAPLFWRASSAAAAIMRLLGGRSGPPIKRSKSVGLTYCVPAIHCRLEMVGRGGITASGLKSLSCDGGSGWPVPQTLSMAISEDEVQPKMSPEGVMTVLEMRGLSSMGREAAPSSLRPGIE